ncbi:hypothetical protein [Burkholderia gladioli]|uniref:hypothetical protein n=1 Tax=Burkholderia gladioli TaxID=28095 RepID=UPI002FDFE5DE
MTNNTTAPALTDEQLTIQWAIESIEASAKSLQECHTQNGTWGDDTEAQSMFEREMEIASALRALLTSPRAAVPAPEGWKLVPIERSYDMRVKALLAFNTTEKETNDRDDALDAAHRAMLDAAPAAPVAEAEPTPMRGRLISSGPFAGRAVAPAAAQAVAADGAALTDEQIRAIENEQAKIPGATRDNLTVRTVRAVLSQARAAVSPATAEPCAHDYVRTDRVCTECGEKTATADERHEDGLLTTEALISIIERHFDHDHPDGQRLVEMAQDVAASQHKQGKPATADERTAFVEKLRELGADISPLGSRDERLCITSNIMVDDVLAAARASQAAAPASKTLSCMQDEIAGVMQQAAAPALVPPFKRYNWDGKESEAGPLVFFLDVLEALKIVEDEQAAAPAEAREPFPYQKTFDAIAAATSITAGGHVSISVEAFRKAFGAIPADAGEAVAPVVAALRKLVHLKSLKDGADRCVPGYIEDRIEYQRDKPKAWDDARAALASFDASQGAQGGKGGEA